MATKWFSFSRWLDQCNPALSKLITETLGSNAWLKDLYKLKGLLKHDSDPLFQKKWAAAKANNKETLAAYIKTTLGITIDTKAMFDVQVKRIHEYKRQSMNILGVIHRYLTIKSMTPAERKKVNPRVVLFAGKAAPGYYMAKLVVSPPSGSECSKSLTPFCRQIRLIVSVSKVINSDPDVKGILTLLFLPDYSVSCMSCLSLIKIPS